MSKRYSVLCYIINNYEIVHEIVEKDPDAEYILVTDDPSLTSTTWDVRFDPDLLKTTSIFDRCYSIRFDVFKYCSTDICVYLDANIHVKKSLKRLIDEFEDGNYEMSMMPHPLRCTFPEEYATWVMCRQYPISQAQKFFDFLRKTNYDLNYRGLFQGCYKIVRKDKVNLDFQNMTLALLHYLGSDTEIERLDQTVYSYVLNTWFTNIRILPVSEQIIRSDWMTYYQHNSTTLNTNIFYDINKPDMKWMFNEQVECMYLS